MRFARIICGMKSITLRGVTVVFDDADEMAVSDHAWWLTPQGYAVTSIRRDDGTRRCIGMHRLLLGDPPQDVVDHINRNRQDNRRENLRACSTSQNMRNQATRSGKSARFRGVSKRGDKWQVVVRINGRITWLGSFDDESVAGAAAAPYFFGIAP